MNLPPSSPPTLPGFSAGAFSDNFGGPKSASHDTAAAQGYQGPFLPPLGGGQYIPMPFGSPLDPPYDFPGFEAPLDPPFAMHPPAFASPYDQAALFPPPPFSPAFLPPFSPAYPAIPAMPSYPTSRPYRSPTLAASPTFSHMPFQLPFFSPTVEQGFPPHASSFLPGPLYPMPAYQTGFEPPGSKSSSANGYSSASGYSSGSTSGYDAQYGSESDESESAASASEDEDEGQSWPSHAHYQSSRGRGSGTRGSRGGGRGRGHGGTSRHGGFQMNAPMPATMGNYLPSSLAKQIDPHGTAALSFDDFTSNKRSRTDSEGLPAVIIKKAKPSLKAPVAAVDDADGHLIIKIGTDLAENYKMLRILGEGTFGKVIECLDKSTNTKVAVKVIKNIAKYRDAAMGEIRVFGALQRGDPSGDRGVIHLLKWFEHKNHVCLVFELLGQSVFDFLRDNSYQPFPVEQIQEFSRQIFHAITFIHNIGMIHTDLKPENILLVNSDFETKQVNSPNSTPKVARSLISTQVRVIDFGSTIFKDDYHSSVICTRHYRAPEIILGLGWSFPCDMWSIGCILLELYTGEALFQTHENFEHLAMMERLIGRIPDSMKTGSEVGKTFFQNGTLRFPDQSMGSRITKKVAKLKPIPELAKASDTITRHFFDLVKRLLEFDPNKRITAEQALRHDFIIRPYDE